MAAHKTCKPCPPCAKVKVKRRVSQSPAAKAARVRFGKAAHACQRTVPAGTSGKARAAKVGACMRAAFGGHSGFSRSKERPSFVGLSRKSRAHARARRRIR